MNKFLATRLKQKSEVVSPVEDGKIYKVCRIGSGEEYAMMVLSNFSPNSYQMILNEASLLKNLNIDEMVKWVAVYMHANNLTMIFDYMDQKSMIDIIKYDNKNYSEEFCRFTLFKVAKGLSKMHAKNVLHRQIMPENVLSSSKCEIKLADLGVRLAPIYAPEIVQGGIFTKASDVWAFGCLAYEMATGAQPFLGRPEAEILRHIMEE